MRMNRTGAWLAGGVAGVAGVGLVLAIGWQAPEPAPSPAYVERVAWAGTASGATAALAVGQGPGIALPVRIASGELLRYADAAAVDVPAIPHTLTPLPGPSEKDQGFRPNGAPPPTGLHLPPTPIPTPTQERIDPGPFGAGELHPMCTPGPSATPIPCS